MLLDRLSKFLIFLRSFQTYESWIYDSNGPVFRPSQADGKPYIIFARVAA